MKSLFLLVALGLVAPVAVNAQDVKVDAPTSYPGRIAKTLDVCPSVKVWHFSFSQELSGNGLIRTYSPEWGNVSEKPVAAFELRVLQFNAFNEPLPDFVEVVPGHNSADYSPLEKGQTGSDGFTEKGDSDMFAGLAYISKVRFVDGSIWRVNPATLNDEIHKALPELDKPAPMLRRANQ